MKLCPILFDTLLNTTSSNTEYLTEKELQKKRVAADVDGSCLLPAPEQPCC